LKVEKNAAVDFVAGTVETSVFDSFEDLSFLQVEWDEFVQQVGGEIFLSFDWCRLWWKYYGGRRQLKVFVFRRQGRIVGLVPLFFEKLWLGPVFVRAVKLVGSDFTIPHFSIPVDPAYMEPVLRAFFAAVADYKLDIIHIGPIAGIYSQYDRLLDTCRSLVGGSYSLVARDIDVQTYFNVPETWEDYLAALGAKERSKMKRHYRLALKAGANPDTTVLADCATEENFDAVFTDFVKMHQRHWCRFGQLGHFADWPEAEQFHREVAAAQLKLNRLCLFAVMLDDTCLGYKYGYIFGNRYFDFLDVRCDSTRMANIGLGWIMYGEMIKKAIKNKATHIDSMRGYYKHKLEMGGQLRHTMSVYIIRRGWSRLTRAWLFRFAAWLLNLFYYRIWYNKVASRLRLKRKGLWTSWIRCNCFS